MRSYTKNPFFSQPTKMKLDNEAIELTEFNQDEQSGGEESECSETSEIIEEAEFYYAIEYASIPLIAAVRAFEESWEEVPDIETHDDLETRIGKRCDKANNCIAAPFLFIPAGCISIFSFFGGAIRDVYEAIKRQNNSDDGIANRRHHNL